MLCRHAIQMLENGRCEAVHMKGMLTGKEIERPRAEWMSAEITAVGVTHKSVLLSEISDVLSDELRTRFRCDHIRFEFVDVFVIFR